MEKPVTKFVPIRDLVAWDRNPRGITKKEFARLKKQIEKLGQYKPLIVTPAKDGRCGVLGGNMRLAAYHEVGFDLIWVSVVDAPTDSMRLQYALSDNDRAGYYDKERLAEITYPIAAEFVLDDFHIDVGETIPLGEVIQEFGPDPEIESGTGGRAPDYSVIVECKSERAQDRTLDKLKAMGLKCHRKGEK